MSNLGINVIEVEGSATPSIVPSETSVAGFIVKSQRGEEDTPIAIRSWPEFVERFGAHYAGYTPRAMGAYALAGFFQNGGSKAYVVRLVPGTAEAATGTIAGKPAEDAEPDDEGPAALTFTAAYRGTEDKGAWGEAITVQVKLAENPPPGSSENLFDLTVSYPAPSAATATATAAVAEQNVVERFENLDFASDSGQIAANRINGTSRFVKIEVHGEPDASADNSASVTLATSAVDEFADSEGNNFDALAESALSLFDGLAVQLLACPETHARAFVGAALDHCEALGARMFVGHVPEADGSLPSIEYFKDADDTKNYDLRGSKVYGALYGPNVLVSDPLGPAPLSIPATGHILGVYARTDRERAVHKAPAGDAARLRGVLDVSARVSDGAHTDYVKKLGINLVRPIPGKGIVIDSARTLSTDPRWFYVSVRRLFNYVKSSLKDSLRWVVAEPNNEKLWARIHHDSLRPFLMSLWRAGAFGPGTPDQVFTITVDKGNNPDDLIDQGILNVDVTFYPSRPAETIVVRIGQQSGAVSASEA